VDPSPLSLLNACAALSDTVRALQHLERKLSSLFLNMKGGFYNVDAKILFSDLQRKGVNHYLVAWVRSFLSGHSYHLVFLGSPWTFSPVWVGTPHGSPVSPLLYVIYVSPLHIPVPTGLVLSYVDDFSLTTSSLSYRSNSRALQHIFGHLRVVAEARQVDFSVLKTELIHWRTPMERDPPTED